MGTVLSVDASEGAEGTFVEVAIKPEWFSARTVEVFINEVELVGAVIEEPAVVEKPALIKQSGSTTLSARCKSLKPSRRTF